MTDPVKTIEVDFTRGLHGGMVRANPLRASAPLERGDRVLAIDEDEEMEFWGTVDRLDDDGFVYLRMDWREASPRRHFDVSFKLAAGFIQSTNVKIDVIPAIYRPDFAHVSDEVIAVWSFVPDESTRFDLFEDEVVRNPALARL